MIKSRNTVMAKNCIWILALLLAGPAHAQTGKSEWVFPGKGGKLVYKTTAAGDRIMDFSHAGYMGGGVALPLAPVKRIVKPSGGSDDTRLIQAALDAVGAMPLKNGLRGAVQLAPGVFTCSAPLVLSASGVVLRGSGSGKGGTTIKMTGNQHTAIVIGRGNTAILLGQTEHVKTQETGFSTSMGTTYVPAGSNSFAVADARIFKVGDTITISRPVTEAWVHFMGMDNMYRDGKKQTWISKNSQGVSRRKIMAISGNTLTVNIPLADSYDPKLLDLPRTIVSKFSTPPRVTQAGVERLHIRCAPLEIDYAHAPYAGIRVGGDDCWVKDVYCEETMNTTVLAGNRITIERLVITHTYPNLGASKPADFSIEGSQNLIDRCEVTGGNTYFVWTSSLEYGPNVLLNCTFKGIGSRIQPHQRWSTALLVDNCTIPDGNIDFMNRGIAGSGHGWTMGWGVAWNCIAQNYIIQNPPGAANWAIGCIGARQQTARLFDTAPILPEGNFDSHGNPVSIQSLYLAQLAERLGTQALKNTGYSSNTIKEFANKTVKPSPAVHADTDPDLGTNLAFGRPVNTSAVRGTTRMFGGEKALDGDLKTYWATNDDTGRATLEVDMEGPVDLDGLKISEALGERVEEYKVEVQANSDWTLVAQGTRIGTGKIERFPKITAWKVKLTILKVSGHPAISEFALFRAGK